MEIPKLIDLNPASIREKVISKAYPEFTGYLYQKYPDYSWPEKLHLYYNNLDEAPVCAVCGKPVKFLSVQRGYRRTCCIKCQSRDPEVYKKKARTSIEHYGVKNPMLSKEVKDKLAKTNLERYGVENPFASEKIKKQIVETNRKKYGVDYPMQSKEIKRKSIETFVERYGVEWNSKIQEVKDSVKKTCEERYGGQGFASTELRQKYNDTCKRNHSHGGTSKVSQRFFKELDKYLFYYTTHYADKDREILIHTKEGNYFADYFIDELGIDVEFNGDLYHGNPKIFADDDHCTPYNRNITAKQLQEADAKRYRLLEEQGIKTIVVWESEYTADFDFEGFAAKIIQLRNDYT